MKKSVIVISVLALFILLLAACDKTAEPDEPSSEQDFSVVNTEELSSEENEQRSAAETTAAETRPDETTTAEKETTRAAETTAAITAAPETQAPKTTVKTQSGGSFSASDLSVVINGVSVKPGQSFESVSSSFGTPSATTNAPSCHYDGMDTIYEYGGFSVYTYASSGGNIIYDIEVTSPSIPTKKGVSVGDSADKVLSAYGDGYSSKTDSLIEYRSGSESLYFSLSGGAVTMIEYYSD